MQVLVVKFREVLGAHLVELLDLTQLVLPAWMELSSLGFLSCCFLALVTQIVLITLVALLNPLALEGWKSKLVAIALMALLVLLVLMGWEAKLVLTGLALLAPLALMGWEAKLDLAGLALDGLLILMLVL